MIRGVSVSFCIHELAYTLCNAVYVLHAREPFDDESLACIDTLSLITEIMYSLWHIIEDAFDAFIMHPIEWFKPVRFT